MICPDAFTLLEQRPLGLLDADETSRLDDHLAGCAECRAEAAALDAVHAELSTVGLPMTLPAPLRDRVIDAMDGVYTEDALAAKSKGLIVAELDHEAVAATAKKISLACSYCHDRTQREELVFCAGCLAPHHEECFAEHGRCSMPGCDELLTVRPGNTGTPQRTGPSRRWRLGLLSLGALVCGAGAAAYSSLEFSRRDAEMHKDRLERRLEEQAALEASRVQEAGGASGGSLSKLGGFLGSKGGKRGAQPSPAFATLDLQVTRANLREAVAQIAAVAEVGISVSADVNAMTFVSVDVRDIPWPEALALVAQQTGCVVQRLAGGSLFLVQPPMVTLQFQAADVRTVILLLASYSGKSIVLGSDVQGRVSPDLVRVPWDAALLALARATDLHVSLVGDVVQVTSQPVEGARPLELTSAQAWLEGYRAERGQEPVTLTLNDVSLVEAVASLQKQVPLTLLLDLPPEPETGAGGGSILNLDEDEVDGSLEEQEDEVVEEELPGERHELLLVERCSLNVVGVSWEEALEALCNEAKLWQDRCGEVVYLRPREVNHLRATGVDVRVWLGALAGMGNANLVLADDVQGTIDYVDLYGASYRAALLATANSLGLKVAFGEGGVYEIRAGSPRETAEAAQSKPQAGTELKGHTFRAHAVLLGALDSSCVLNDTTYARHDSLVDSEGDELSQLRVSGIYPDRVEISDTTDPDEVVTHVLLLD